jgi:hypothetical protein
MATFIHATLRSNVPEIKRRGLLPAKSRQRRKAVWFVRPGLVDWACRHAVERAGGSVQDVVVMEVEIPAEWVRHHGGGLYYCDRVVPSSRLTRMYGFVREIIA